MNRPEYAGLRAVLHNSGFLRPEMHLRRPNFAYKEVPRMAFPAKLGETNTGNTAGIVSARCGIRGGALVAA